MSWLATTDCGELKGAGVGVSELRAGVGPGQKGRAGLASGAALFSIIFSVAIGLSRPAFAGGSAGSDGQVDFQFEIGRAHV